MFLFNRVIIFDMKRLIYLAVASAFAFALYSCSDTNDCVCTYENGTEATVSDWSGDCSQINVIDLTKKAAPGSSTPVSCVDM